MNTKRKKGENGYKKKKRRKLIDENNNRKHFVSFYLSNNFSGACIQKQIFDIN